MLSLDFVIAIKELMLRFIFWILVGLLFIWRRVSECSIEENVEVSPLSSNSGPFVVELDDAVRRWSTNNTFHYAVVGDNYAASAVSTFLDSNYEYIRQYTFVTPSLKEYAVCSSFVLSTRFL